MEATRPRSSTQGLSAFLVDHGACGQGFDVTHPDGLGNGRIEIVCRDCGRSYSYAPGRIRVEREIEIEPVRRAGAGAKTDSRPPSPTEKKASDERSPRERALVLLLLLFAVAAFAFAAFRVADDRSGDSGSDLPPAPRTAAPAVQTIEGDGYSLVVPGSWRRSDKRGNTVVTAPDGNASLEIFASTNPDLARAAFLASAASFLESVPPGGTVARPGPAGARGKPGFTLVDSGPGGSQQAVGVISGPRRYLAVGTKTAQAGPEEGAAVDSALASFSVR